MVDKTTQDLIKEYKDIISFINDKIAQLKGSGAKDINEEVLQLETLKQQQKQKERLGAIEKMKALIAAKIQAIKG